MTDMQKLFGIGFLLLIILYKIPLLLALVKWKVIDVYRSVRYGKPLHIYGIWCFVGIYGGGKTMSLVNYLEEMRKKHGDGIYIATNFYYTGQDFAIESWTDLLPERDKPVIFAYDELQNEFNSRDYRNFPDTLMYLLTQNRKGNGKQIVYTTQDYEVVDKNFRRLTTEVVVCRTLWGRMTRCRHYLREQYENLCTVTDIKRRMKIRPFKTVSFVQSDHLRNLYDSYQMLETAKAKTYLDRTERSK